MLPGVLRRRPPVGRALRALPPRVAPRNGAPRSNRSNLRLLRLIRRSGPRRTASASSFCPTGMISFPDGMRFFGSLKLSKARRLVPERKLVDNAYIANMAMQRIKGGPPLVGPLTPSGHYLSSRRTKSLVEGFRLPKPSEWANPNSCTKYRGLGGDWEPVSLRLVPLKSNEIRRLSHNPSKRWKANLPKGEYEVFPNRASVTLFNRRACTYNYLEQVANLKWVSRPSIDLEKVYSEGIQLALQFFGRWADGSRERRSLLARLAHSRRQVRKQANGLGRRL